MNDTSINAFNLKIRQTPWYQEWFAQRGLNPNQVKLNDQQRAELQGLVQQKAGFVFPKDMKIDPAGNLNEKGGWAGLPTGVKIAIIAGATVATAGAAGAFAGGAGAASGVAGGAGGAAAGGGVTAAGGLGAGAAAGAGGSLLGGLGGSTAMQLGLLGASSLSGALGNRSQTNTSTSTTTPTMDPKYSGLQDTLLQSIQGRLSAPSALPQGYETQGIGKINNAFDIVRQAQNNNLTARGLGASPIAGNVDATRGFQRAGQIGQFQAGLPGVERNFRNQDMGMASELLSMGRGQTYTGTQTQPGNVAGGSINGFAEMIGYLYRTGQLGGGKQSNPLAPYTMRPGQG